MIWYILAFALGAIIAAVVTVIVLALAFAKGTLR